MICPECSHENNAGTPFCGQCGAVLTQSELTACVPHRTNQVWNTDIEKDRNQANSRIAMIVLGTSVVLVFALIVAVCLMLPSMGDALMSERESKQSVIERIDEFLEFVADTSLNLREPVPESYAAISEGADEDFVELLEEFLKKIYDNNYADLSRLSERYYKEFAAFQFEDFTDWNLADAAVQTAQALDKICRGSNLTDEPLEPDVTHAILQLEGCVELYSVVEELYECYGILYNKDYIPDFYIRMLPIYQVQLEVEYDLTAQLNSAAVSYTEGDPIPYLSYTNNTPYELELTVYNDYYNGADFYNDESYIPSVMPNETIIIPLPNMPAKYEDHYTHWSVHTYSLDGLDIYDYYR